jgi:hypothetical protein
MHQFYSIISSWNSWILKHDENLCEYSSMINKHNLKLPIEKEQTLEDLLLVLKKNFVSITTDAFTHGLHHDLIVMICLLQLNILPFCQLAMYKKIRKKCFWYILDTLSLRWLIHCLCVGLLAQVHGLNLFHGLFFVASLNWTIVSSPKGFYLNPKPAGGVGFALLSFFFLFPCFLWLFFLSLFFFYLFI